MPDSAELPGAPPVPAAGAPELKSLLVVVVSVVVVAALYIGKDVLVPIVLAMMLSFVLTPLVDLVQRTGVSRAPSVIFTVLLAFCVIVLGGVLMARQASALAADAPRYATAIDRKVQSVQMFTTSHLMLLTRLFARGEGATPTANRSGASSPAGNNLADANAAREQPVPVKIAPASGASVVFGTILAPVVGPMETAVIVVVIAIFMLVEREDLRDRFIRLAGSEDLQRTTVAMNDAGARLSRYFVSQLAVNATFGTVIGVGLWTIGIPAAGFWGVAAGLLRFIPYVGPVLAAIGPFALGAAIDPGWRAAIEVALLFVVVEPFTGYLVEPLLYGHSTGLAPISVIVAAVFWTWIWGPVGLIISTPLTLCLVVMGRHVKSLEFFDVLLGDRPALTPADSFYQRILANDPDDALARAETILEEQSLLQFYETVVLEALKRAAQDRARGALPAARAADVTSRTIEVIGDLKDFESARPQPSQVTYPLSVLCVAGRGAFDDAVTAMLAQLLQERGIRTRRVGYGAVSRDRIAGLDPADATVMLISYLDPVESTAHVKYLIRRLRRRAPQVRIVLGLWAASTDRAAHDAPAQTVGADACVTSLQDALAACLPGAHLNG